MTEFFSACSADHASLEELVKSQHREVLGRLEAQEQLLTQLLTEQRAPSAGQIAGASNAVMLRNSAGQGSSSTPVPTTSGQAVNGLASEKRQVAKSSSNLNRKQSSNSGSDAGGTGRASELFGSSAITPYNAKRRHESGDVLSKASSFKLDFESDASGPIRRNCRRFTSSSAFEMFFAVLIMLNAVAIGVEVDDQAQRFTEEKNMELQIVSYTFSLAFAFELACRLVSQGLGFCCNQDMGMGWIFFDAFLVCSSVVEVVLEHVGGKGNATADLSSMRLIRIVRITRLVRLLRLVRIVRFVRALRVLLHSMFTTMKSLVWTMLLLTINIYFFAILFTQTSVQHLIGLEEQPCVISEEACTAYEENLRSHWGTLPRSMLTLFACITGGIDWIIVARPIGAIGWFWMALFIVFVSVTVFAVFNVITGVFCNSAVEGANRDRDLMVKQLMANKEAHVKNVRQQFEVMFEAMDKSGGGTINKEDFEAQLSDDVAKEFLILLDIDASEAFKLFKLLDRDGSNSIDAEEFVEGCLKLKGPAKNLELAAMRIDLGRLRKAMKQDTQTLSTWMRASSQTLQLVASEIHALSHRGGLPNPPGVPSARDRSDTFSDADDVVAV